MRRILCSLRFRLSGAQVGCRSATTPTSDPLLTLCSTFKTTEEVMPAMKAALRAYAEAKGRRVRADRLQNLLDNPLVRQHFDDALSRSYTLDMFVGCCCGLMGRISESQFLDLLGTAYCDGSEHELVLAKGTKSPIPFGELHIIDTVQWREVLTEEMKPIKDAKLSDPEAKGQPVYQILILSGDSGAGKSVFAVQRAYQKFKPDQTSNVNVVTYYVSANSDAGFNELRMTLATIPPSESADNGESGKDGGTTTKAGGTDRKERRDEACAAFMEKLITTAREATAEYRNWLIHIVIDECGLCREAVRGIVSTVEKWARSMVRLTLCSTGLDLTVKCHAHGVYVRSDPATNAAYYTLVHLSPWTSEDAKEYFQHSLGSNFDQLWGKLNLNPTLMALTANARCSYFIREALHYPLEAVVWRVADLYKGRNGLQEVSSDELHSLIRTTLFYAVGSKEVKACCKAFGEAFKEPTPEEIERASGNGMLSLRIKALDASTDPPTRSPAVPLSSLSYDVSCAMVAMCAVQFGITPTATRTHAGFEEDVALYCHSALTAAGVKDVPLVKLGKQLPPVHLLTSAADLFDAVGTNTKDSCDVEWFIPNEFLQVREGKLDVKSEESGIVIINGDLAPSWDVAIGYRREVGPTHWALFQAKYTAGTAPLRVTSWKSEVQKLGTSLSVPPDSPPQPIPSNETSAQRRERLAPIRAWLEATMVVKRRCLISNGRLTDDVPATTDPVEFIKMGGPFADLANLLSTRQSLSRVQTCVKKVGAETVEMVNSDSTSDTPSVRGK